MAEISGGSNAEALAAVIALSMDAIVTKTCQGVDHRVESRACSVA